MRASVIIPNYNYARYLRQCIDSALSQNFDDFEVIVVDDASKDESREVIESYGDRILPILQTVNAGHAMTFNVALEKSRGRMIVFLDADDYLLPDALSLFDAVMQPGVAMAHGRLQIVDDKGALTGYYPHMDYKLPAGDLRNQMLATGRMVTAVTSGLAFAREALEAVMPIPAAEFRPSGDGYLTAVVPLVGPVAAVEQVVGAYRQHGGNHSNFSGTLTPRCRWRIQHNVDRIAGIRRVAAKLGLTPSPSLGEADIMDLEDRMASLVLDRDQHPRKDDSKADLALKGLRATAADRRPALKKILLLLWFAAVGALPRALSERLIYWRLLPSTRPQGFKTLVAALKN